MTATAVDPKVKEFTARRWQLLIDGKWVKAKSEQTFQTHNPATGELLAECAQASQYPSREQIAESLGGNLCRCGCYVKIIDAVQEVSS